MPKMQRPYRRSRAVELQEHPNEQLHSRTAEWEVLAFSHHVVTWTKSDSAQMQGDFLTMTEVLAFFMGLAGSGLVIGVCLLARVCVQNRRGGDHHKD
jgi:hypothetical protein